MEPHSSRGKKHGRPEQKSKILDLLENSMKLSESDILLDVGSGDGYYSSRFAEKCRKVVAIDAYCEGFSSEFYSKPNIQTVCGDVCRWLSENGIGDVTHVFFSNSFHDMTCQEEILSTLSRSLPAGAHLDMIEFHPDTPYGPPKSIRFSSEALKSKIERFGFSQEAYIDLNTHYFVSFAKVK